MEFQNLAITKALLYERYFKAIMSESTYGRLLKKCLPDEARTTKVLLPKHLKVFQENIGSEADLLK